MFKIIPEVIINEDGQLIIKNLNDSDTLHITDACRHFVEDLTDICIKNENEEKQIICVDFRSAWEIDAEGLRKISEKYNVDFKIYAFECGGQFNIDLEIVEGEIYRNRRIEFSDYIWECIMPELGG